MSAPLLASSQTRRGLGTYTLSPERGDRSREGVAGVDGEARMRSAPGVLAGCFTHNPVNWLDSSAPRLLGSASWPLPCGAFWWHPIIIRPPLGSSSASEINPLGMPRGFPRLWSLSFPGRREPRGAEDFAEPRNFPPPIGDTGRHAAGTGGGMVGPIVAIGTRRPTPYPGPTPPLQKGGPPPTSP